MSADLAEKKVANQDTDIEPAPESSVGRVQAREPEEPQKEQPKKKPRGFAAMDAAKQREIASKGGRAAHEKGTAHEFSADEARKAGRKGGEVVSRSKEHMANIGRKGGAAVSANRGHMAAIGRKGGEAVSSDRSHMAAIGRKGGEARGESRGDSNRGDGR